MNQIQRFTDAIRDISPIYYWIALAIFAVGSIFFGSAAWIANLAPIEVLLPVLETIGLGVFAILAYRIVTWISSRATGLAKIIIAIVVIAIAAGLFSKPFTESRASNQIALLDKIKYLKSGLALGYRLEEIPPMPDKREGTAGLSKIEWMVDKAIHIDFPKTLERNRSFYVKIITDVLLANNPDDVLNRKAELNFAYKTFYEQKAKTIYLFNDLAIVIVVLCQSALALFNMIKSWKFLGGMVKISLGGLVIGVTLVMYMKIFYIPDGPTQKIVDDLWWKGFLIHIPQLFITIGSIAVGASSESVKEFVKSKNVFLRVLLLALVAISSQILGSFGIDSLFQTSWLLNAVNESAGRLSMTEAYLVYQSGIVIAGLAITSLYSTSIKILSGKAAEAQVQ